MNKYEGIAPVGIDMGSVKVKVTFFLSTTWRRIEGTEVYLHSFLAWALDVGKWSTWCPDGSTSWEVTRYPLDRRLGGPQSHSGRSGVEKCLVYCRDSNTGSHSL
jgi:hypothetical protein